MVIANMNLLASAGQSCHNKTIGVFNIFYS